MDHDEATDRHYEASEESLQDGYWQDCFKEVSYFEDDVSPHPPNPDQPGLEVGEFDVLLVNYDDQLAYYKEIKTKKSDLGYAREQIERAKAHFEDDEWDVIGKRVLEDGEDDFNTTSSALTHT